MSSSEIVALISIVASFLIAVSSFVYNYFKSKQDRVFELDKLKQAQLHEDKTKRIEVLIIDIYDLMNTASNPKTSHRELENKTIRIKKTLLTYATGITIKKYNELMKISLNSIEEKRKILLLAQVILLLREDMGHSGETTPEDILRIILKSDEKTEKFLKELNLLEEVLN